MVVLGGWRFVIGGAAFRVPTMEVTQGQIGSQSPTDAARFWWHLYSS